VSLPLSSRRITPILVGSFSLLMGGGGRFPYELMAFREGRAGKEDA